MNSSISSYFLPPVYTRRFFCKSNLNRFLLSLRTLPDYEFMVHELRTLPGSAFVLSNGFSLSLSFPVRRKCLLPMAGIDCLREKGKHSSSLWHRLLLVTLHYIHCVLEVFVLPPGCAAHCVIDRTLDYLRSITHTRCTVSRGDMESCNNTHTHCDTCLGSPRWRLDKETLGRLPLFPPCGHNSRASCWPPLVSQPVVVDSDPPPCGLFPSHCHKK